MHSTPNAAICMAYDQEIWNRRMTIFTCACMTAEAPCIQSDSAEIESTFSGCVGRCMGGVYIAGVWAARAVLS